MTGVAAKWAVRRYQPAYDDGFSLGALPLVAKGKEQIFDEWRDVVAAADTIIGDNTLQMGVAPSDPLVIKHGDDVVLIYVKLEI